MKIEQIEELRKDLMSLRDEFIKSLLAPDPLKASLTSTDQVSEQREEKHDHFTVREGPEVAHLLSDYEPAELEQEAYPEKVSPEISAIIEEDSEMEEEYGEERAEIQRRRETEESRCNRRCIKMIDRQVEDMPRPGSGVIPYEDDDFQHPDSRHLLSESPLLKQAIPGKVSVLSDASFVEIGGGDDSSLFFKAAKANQESQLKLLQIKIQEQVNKSIAQKIVKIQLFVKSRVRRGIKSPIWILKHKLVAVWKGYRLRERLRSEKALKLIHIIGQQQEL
jgi:hypothetical protein